MALNKKVQSHLNNRNANWNYTDTISQLWDWQKLKGKTTICWWGCGEIGTHTSVPYAGGNANWYNSYSWGNLEIFNKNPRAFDLPFLLLGIYPENTPSTMQQQQKCIYTIIRCSIFFVNTKWWKLECPHIGEWLNYCVQHLEYYVTAKKEWEKNLWMIWNNF